jgi:hypothetical protein
MVLRNWPSLDSSSRSTTGDVIDPFSQALYSERQFAVELFLQARHLCISKHFLSVWRFLSMLSHVYFECKCILNELESLTD